MTSHRVVSGDGTTIAYEKHGHGPALILVDGAFCCRTMGPMPKLAHLLAPSFTVYLYDRRGRGESENREPYAIARELEDIAALMEVASGSAHLLGMSSGAALVIHAAASGLPVNRLVLYEPPFITQKQFRRPPADYRATLQAMIDGNRRGDAASFYLTSVIGMPSVVTFGIRLSPLWKKMKAIAHTLPYDAEIMNDFELPLARLSLIRIPTLVVGGEKSPAMLRASVQATAAQLVRGSAVLLPKQTHNVRPNVLAPVVNDFLNSADQHIRIDNNVRVNHLS
jgi:pimeloyl-ACP methyl ester carboxylesterase